MSKFWKMIGSGALVVLAFDTAASFVSLSFGFPYAYASAGSVLIYITVGYLVFRQYSLSRAVGAVLLVEAVEATLGWFISWKIGPGALPQEQVTPALIAASILFVFILAAVCAVIGSAIARALHGPRSANE